MPGGPVGIGFHYTGGTNGVATARWFNQPSLGNTDSSCHALVLDRLIPELATLWPTLEAAALFPVPTLLLANPDRATWHMNWANSRTFGVENRNAGYSGYQKLAGGLQALGKQPYLHGGRQYEPYGREQVEANILLGRMWRALRGDLFDPTWVVGHSQVWAIKADPGPAFPSMDEMREAIWSDQPLDQIEWLGRYNRQLASPDGVDGDAVDHQDVHDDPEPSPQTWDPTPLVVAVPDQQDRPFLVHALRQMGWPVADGQDLASLVANFQRSTLAFGKTGHPDRILAADGQAGPKTLAALHERLRTLGLPE